jgi:hypothetical protein
MDLTRELQIELRFAEILRAFVDDHPAEWISWLATKQNEIPEVPAMLTEMDLALQRAGCGGFLHQ